MSANPSPPAKAVAHLRINPIHCTAFGFCAEYAPELFQLDDWGYGWLRQTEITADQLELAQKAANLCPKRAILLNRIHERRP